MERIEPDFEDEGSYAESLSSTSDSTASVNSSILQGIQEYGRKYASYGKGDYGMPIDEEELDRIDMKHRLYTMLLDEKLFLAPLGANPQRVLDLGTGSGIWAIEMADTYPSADILGVDLASIQPDWVPPNCRFEIDDVEEDWTFNKDSFDFIHARDFLVSIRDWKKLSEQCYEHVKPGGFCEFQCLLPEPNCDDGSTPTTTGVWDFSTKVIEASEINGVSLREPNNYAVNLRLAGFEDVVEKRFKIPTGPWAKDTRMKLIGAFETQSLLQGASAFSLRMFSKAFGWTQDQTELYLMGLRSDVRNMKYHTYYEFIVAYGRKPGGPKTNQTEPKSE